jgi:phosphoglycolate phosphatase
MQKKVLIFDFDGTLADTLAVIVDITNHLASEFGYPTSSTEKLAQIRQLGAWQVIQQSGVSIFKLPSLVRKIQQELSKEIENAQLFPDMDETLRQLKNNGHILGIVSSNSSENVNRFLEVNQLKHLFDFVVSSTTLFGKHRSLNKIIQQQDFRIKNVIYIGDETRDIEAAKKIGIEVIAVSWGFNSIEVLADHEPDYLLYSPLEILKVVNHD